MTTIRLMTMTLALAAALVSAPQHAHADTGGNEETPVRVTAEDVPSLRCFASAARAEMRFFACLSRCALHAGAEGRCEARCEDRRAARTAELACLQRPALPARKKGPCTFMGC